MNTNDFVKFCIDAHVEDSFEPFVTLCCRRSADSSYFGSVKYMDLLEFRNSLLVAGKDLPPVLFQDFLDTLKNRYNNFAVQKIITDIQTESLLDTL